MAKLLMVLVFVCLTAVVIVPSAGLAIFHIVPIKTIEDSIKRQFSGGSGITLHMRGFERVFPFGLRASEIILEDASSGRPVISIDGAWIGFNPVSVFSGGLGADFKASLYGGIVSGSMLIRPSGKSLEAKVRSIRLFSIPALKRHRITAGMPFDGELKMELSEKGCPAGDLSLSGIADPGVDVLLGGLPLPIGLIDSAGLEVFADGAMTGDSCSIGLKDLWFKGGEIEGHASGMTLIKAPVEASLVDAELVLSPKGRLARQEYLLSLIKEYKTKEGGYKIPLKGALGEVFSE